MTLAERGLLGYLEALWSRRYFLGSLVRMDLRLRYRRSTLGMSWSLLNPLMMTAILCFAFNQLFQVPVKEYAPFLLVGLAFWQFVSTAAQTGCHSLLMAEPYIRQHPCPMALYPLRTTLSAFVHHVMALLVAVGIAAAFQGAGNPLPLLWLVPALLLLVAFAWAVATVMGFLNAHFPDTTHLLETCLQFLYYLTPIMYVPGKMGGKMAALLEMNPLGWLVRLLRDPILKGQGAPAEVWQGSLLFVAAAVAAAYLVLKRHERDIVFKL